MADFSLLLLLLVFSSFSGLHSRSLPLTPKTSVLDVAASIQRTTEIFAFQAESTVPEREQIVSDSSSLALQLNSRISILKTSHSDYKSLTLARLERDSARVRSLTARIDLAVRGIGGADLKPFGNGGGSQFGAEDFESPIVSGASQGSGEYFSRVGIGKPPSPVYMVLDTGSDVSWVQCAPCADCYEQTDPIFEPASSASFSSLSCQTEQCKSLDVSECRNGTCLYEVSYGDGSYTVGDFVTETVTLGSTSLRNIALGCGHNNEGLFIGAAG
ncbi:protein ASPARTIC PROTEASE IN GUARD CELL 1, partial [Momordica charantia]|uniref:Protein ASPARTIC PROTEASE IN GUARD CELL 1 n=1 Tax=Momordica charantia TaxID=3673 RepID=A0A6J1DAC8_MOMCH